MASLEPMRDLPGIAHPNNLYVLHGEEWRRVFGKISTLLLGQDPSSETAKELMESFDYVDYIVIGSYQSPQLFRRQAPDGTPLGLDEQSWPADLSVKAAPSRSETVYFTMA